MNRQERTSKEEQVRNMSDWKLLEAWQVQCDLAEMWRQRAIAAHIKGKKSAEYRNAIGQTKVRSRFRLMLGNEINRRRQLFRKEVKP